MCPSSLLLRQISEDEFDLVLKAESAKLHTAGSEKGLNIESKTSHFSSQESGR